MVRETKDRGKSKTLNELLDSEEKRVTRGIQRRTSALNSFPFSPVRDGRPNPLGLNLDKFDCRILRAVQDHGFKPVREFCKLARVKESVFYQRFRDNPDLGEALKLLAFSSLAISFPKAMETLSGKFESNPKWAELWLKVVGLINEPSMKLVGRGEGVEDRGMIETRINQFLLEGGTKE